MGKQAVLGLKEWGAPVQFSRPGLPLDRIPFPSTSPFWSPPACPVTRPRLSHLRPPRPQTSLLLCGRGQVSGEAGHGAPRAGRPHEP